MRLVMMGTGTFALPTFLSLYESRYEVVGLFTQPDRAGRGHHHHPHPMKETALERGTPVFQPENINTPEAMSDLRSLAADLAVVAAYGQILSAEVLSTPARGAINLHASLLPKYRGAAPIQYAILHGEEKTGITIFQIDPRLDAGMILGTVETTIGPKETAGELEDRLAELALPLVHRVLDQIESNTVNPRSQDPALVTRAPRLKKSAGLIDWSKPAREIGWKVRALQPWPLAFTHFVQSGRSPKRIILLDVDALSEHDPSVPAGTVTVADGKRLVVQAGEGSVQINTLQPDGKRAMSAAAFSRGHAIQPGDRFAAVGD